jgi:hypothetical protein
MRRRAAVTGHHDLTRPAGFFLSGGAGYTVQNHVLMATWWLHDAEKQKRSSAFFEQKTIIFTGGEGVRRIISVKNSHKLNYLSEKNIFTPPKLIALHQERT